MIETVIPESVGMSSERLGRVSDWLQQQVESERLAGASVLIGRHGQVAHVETAGYREQTESTPFEEDTIVRIYSMSKPVTTVAAMMLYEAGCFQLDHPVSEYLPEFADTPVWVGGNAPLSETVPQTSPMLVRHIMSHTSGLTYGFMRTNVVDEAYRKNGLEPLSPKSDLAEWTKKLAGIPLVCQPGSQWNYSVSSDVLGRLVEVWSGMRLDQFFEDKIFTPLGMTDTGFVVPESKRDRFSALYAPLVGGSLGQADPPPMAERGGLKLQDAVAGSAYFASPGVFSGGGGLVSTMSDYHRFCQMLQSGGEFDGCRLLAPSTVQHMRTNHLPDNKDMAAMGQPVWSETSYDGIGFGLGFAVVLDPVTASIITSPGEYHWGGAASTFFWIDPVQDLHVVFLTQLMPSSTYPIRRELRTLVYQAITGP